MSKSSAPLAVVPATPADLGALATAINATHASAKSHAQLGGMDTIMELPDYTPAADLRALIERMKIAGGKPAFDLLKRWSRLPGRQRILYGRLQKAYRLAKDTGAPCIKLSHLEAADALPVPPVSEDEDDEGGAA